MENSFLFFQQGEFLAAKRAKEEAAQAIKMEAKQAVRRREKAIYDARIALVGHDNNMCSMVQLEIKRLV